MGGAGVQRARAQIWYINLDAMTLFAHATSKNYIELHVNNIYIGHKHAHTHTRPHDERIEESEKGKRDRKISDICTHCTTDCDYTITHNLNTMHFSFILIGFV